MLSERLRIPLEQVVSVHCAREWAVREFQDLNDFACHPAAILSDGAFPVFVKFSPAAHAAHQFEVELAGLRCLSELAGAQIPSPIGIIPIEGGVLLALEAVQTIERKAEEWRDIGRTLARIHQVKGPAFGWTQQGYFGPLYQDNRPLADWLTFFAERRLWPRFAAAVDSGNLPSELIRQIERLIAHLPTLDLPDCQPTLLHGDAQQNNFLSASGGALVIDPAVYYGHPEMDLAHLDYFQPVPPEVFLGYQELLPILPGFEQRRNLWRLPALLAAVQVEGVERLEKLTTAVGNYL